MLLRRFRLTTKSEFDYQGLFLSEEFAFIQFRDTHKVAQLHTNCQQIVDSIRWSPQKTIVDKLCNVCSLLVVSLRINLWQEEMNGLHSKLVRR